MNESIKADKTMDELVKVETPQEQPAQAARSHFSFSAFRLNPGDVIGLLKMDDKGNFVVHAVPFKVKQARRDGKIILKPVKK
jgi:hypothetical protein